MADRDISPLPDSPQRRGAGHYRADDDIELPPIPDTESGGHAAIDWPTDQDTSNQDNGTKSKGIWPLLGAAALLVVLAVGGWVTTKSGSTEQAHPNWTYVAAAADASGADASKLVHLDDDGGTQVLPMVEVARADLDRSTTRQVRAALRRSDLVTATARLQTAQSLPSASENPDVQLPELVADSEWARAIQDGDQELFQIELFDCCDEDGDIVEVLVNGARFATVPILHDGTKLSIPLARGNNSVTVRGVKDGGGGVTLSFRTSRGDYFARSMRVGQEYQMGVVVR